MKYTLYFGALLALGAWASPIPQGVDEYDEYDPDCIAEDMAGGDVIVEPAPEFSREVIRPGRDVPAIRRIIPVVENNGPEVEATTEADAGECETTEDMGTEGDCNADPCQSSCPATSCTECPFRPDCENNGPQNPCDNDPCGPGCPAECGLCPDNAECQDPCEQNPCNPGCPAANSPTCGFDACSPGNLPQDCSVCPDQDHCPAPTPDPTNPTDPDGTPECEAEDDAGVEPEPLAQDGGCGPGDDCTANNGDCQDGGCPDNGGCEDGGCQDGALDNAGCSDGGCPDNGGCDDNEGGCPDNGGCEDGGCEEEIPMNRQVVNERLEPARILPDTLYGEQEVDDVEDCIDE